MKVPAEEVLIIVHWACHSQSLVEMVNAELKKHPGYYLIESQLVPTSYKLPDKAGTGFLYNLVFWRPANGKTDGT